MFGDDVRIKLCRSNIAKIRLTICEDDFFALLAQLLPPQVQLTPDGIFSAHQVLVQEIWMQDLQGMR